MFFATGRTGSNSSRRSPSQNCLLFCLCVFSHVYFGRQPTPIGECLTHQPGSHRNKLTTGCRFSVSLPCLPSIKVARAQRQDGFSLESPPHYRTQATKNVNNQQQPPLPYCRYLQDPRHRLLLVCIAAVHGRLLWFPVSRQAWSGGVGGGGKRFKKAGVVV